MNELLKQAKQIQFILVISALLMGFSRTSDIRPYSSITFWLGWLGIIVALSLLNVFKTKEKK